LVWEGTLRAIALLLWVHEKSNKLRPRLLQLKDKGKQKIIEGFGLINKTLFFSLTIGFGKGPLVPPSHIYSAYLSIQILSFEKHCTKADAHK
jgi:hypothetical protein